MGIYTRRGDGGLTALAGGIRVRKTHPRIEALGVVDELNSMLGLLRLKLKGKEAGLVRRVQCELFELGADLASVKRGRGRARLGPGLVVRIEREIDAYNSRVTPVAGFVLPGGTRAAAWCHLARTVCRRAERAVAAAAAPEALVYLNRLSDFLFVLARFLNARGRGDIRWTPGKTAKR